MCSGPSEDKKRLQNLHLKGAFLTARQPFLKVALPKKKLLVYVKICIFKNRTGVKKAS